MLPRYGHDIVGGSEALGRRLALQLAARGWRVEAWATTAEDESTWRGELPAQEDDSGVTVRRFPVPRHRHPVRFRRATRAFFRVPSRLRPERAWIRAQGPFSPALIRALRTAPSQPVLFSPYLYHPTLAGINASGRPRLLMPAAHDEPALRLRAVARAVTAADAIWYHTPEERDLLERTHPESVGKPSVIGTVGVEAASGDAARFRARHRIDSAFFLLSGRSTPGKGRAEALEAFAALRATRDDVRLVVSGEQPPSTAPPGVIYLGRIDQAAMGDALAAASAVVVASAMESLSMLALEAWNAGTPALLNARSTVLAGQAARSGGALLYGDAAGFVEAARALLDDPALASRLGDAGRTYVAAHHRWDDVVTRLTDLITSAEEQHDAPD